MSKDLATLIEDTRFLVGDPLRGDPAEQPTTYTQDQVVKAINWSIAMLCIRTGYTYNLTSPNTVGNGMFATPHNSLKINYVMNGTTVLDPSTVEWENIKDPTWRSSGLSATRYVMEGTNIHPVGTVSSLNIGFIEKPDDLIAPDSTVDDRIPDFFQDAIKYGAGSYIKNLDGSAEDIAIADKFMNSFNELLAGARASATVPQQR